MRELELRASIQYKTSRGALNFGDSGEASPLEVNVIELASTQTRFFDFGPRTIVNYDTFSLLIKNMPVEKPEKYVQIKDTLGSLCNAIEAKVQNLLAIDNDVQRKAVLDVVQHELNDIKKGFNKLLASGRATLLNMIDDIDLSVKQLGLTASQEQNIHAIACANTEKMQKVFDESKNLSGKFVDVKDNLDHVMKASGQG